MWGDEYFKLFSRTLYKRAVETRRGELVGESHGGFRGFAKLSRPLTFRLQRCVCKTKRCIQRQTEECSPTPERSVPVPEISEVKERGWRTKLKAAWVRVKDVTKGKLRSIPRGRK